MNGPDPSHTMPHPTTGDSPRHPSSFRANWLAEVIRLRETRWGGLDDAVECRRARAQGGSLVQRIQTRAWLLGQREGLDQALTRWLGLARLALFGLLLLGLLAGGSAALAALGDNRSPVNLAMALLALLGLHLLTLLIWLASLLRSGPAEPSASLLGRAWLWLANRLARGPDQALAPAALVEWLGTHGLLRWLLGSISHLTWLMALLGQIIVLLVMLSAKRYAFSWETTLLPAGFFIEATQWLGWLPARLGFALPDPALTQASINLPAATNAVQVQWSSWLIGCIVVYGVLPRLLALSICLFQSRRRLPRLSVDTQQPDYAALRPRLMPTSERIGSDAPAGPPDLAPARPTKPSTPPAAQTQVVALELPDDAPWPPAELPTNTYAAGNLTGRDQREHFLQTLYRQPPVRLLLICDGDQTPDRGTQAFLHEVHALVGLLHVAVISPDHDAAPARRLALWQAVLAKLPLPVDHIHVSLDAALEALRHEQA